jgi:hypothetical protein
VTVSGEGVETSHKVSVPETLIDDLALPEVDRETLVKESFEFLLEREPPTSILREFPLTTIADYFPDYLDELRRRLS